MNGPRFATSRITHWLGIGALALALVVGGGGAWLGQAGPALAPPAAKLTQGLGGTLGATAQAVFTTTQVQTTVLMWPGSSVATANPPAAGTPCSTGPMVVGQITTKAIQRNGIYAKCV